MNAKSCRQDFTIVWQCFAKKRHFGLCIQKALGQQFDFGDVVIAPVPISWIQRFSNFFCYGILCSGEGLLLRS